MSLTEVLLLILGAAIFTAGYLLPSRRTGASDKLSRKQEQLVKELVQKEVEDARGKIEDIVDETVNYSVEKTERSMERLSNEKIMAINEYSDTVLQEIHKNHEETVFLFDMLNHKHDTFMSTISAAGKTVTEVKQTLQDAQVTAKEVRENTDDTPAAGQQPGQEAARQPERGFVPIQAAKVQDLDAVLEQAVYAGNGGASETAIERLQKATQDKKKGGGAPVSQKKKSAAKAEAAGRVSPDLSLSQGVALGRNNNDRILEMYKAGKSNMSIAKELGLGIGEVKLVIDLYKGIGG